MVKSRKMGRVWHRKITNPDRILVTKLQVKSPLGKPRYKWKDNTETECESINGIQLVLDRVQQLDCCLW
jgi:hypothetical protein